VSQAKTYQYSHLAKVVLAGLQEYQFQQDAGGTLHRDDIVDTVRRAIQRATALTSNDLKKGIPSLATIGATAPFVGLLGTVVGVINAFHGIAATGSAASAPCPPVFPKRCRDRARPRRRHPAVWIYNYFTGRLEYFNVEMDNSSSELVDYFIKKTAVETADRPSEATGAATARGPAPHSEGDLPWQWMSAAPKAASRSTSTSRRSSTSCWCLLIIMMLIAPMLQQGRRCSTLPSRQHDDKPDTATDVVHMTRTAART
jgi:hypothetical protein